MSRSTRGRLLAPTAGRKDWVDLAKGVAIVLVIAYHSSLFLRSIELDTGGMGRVKAALEALPMPVFLLIAGMFHARVVQWSLRDTWKRRLLGYAYLYLLWCVLRFAFYLVVPNVRDDGAGSLAESPLALLLAPVWPTSSYWFIWSLFVLTLLLWSVRRVHRALVVSVAAVVCLAVGSGLVVTGNVGWDRTAEYAVFFLVGALWSRRIFDAVAVAPLWAPVAGVLLWGAAAAAAAFVPGGVRVPGVVAVAQVGAVVACVTLAHRCVRLRPLHLVSYLGVRSLHLYLVHIFVIALLALGLEELHESGVAVQGGTALLVGVTLLVTVLSAALSRVVARFRWLFVPPRALAGGRAARTGRLGAPSAASSGPQRGAGAA